MTYERIFFLKLVFPGKQLKNMELLVLIEFFYERIFISFLIFLL